MLVMTGAKSHCLSFHLPEVSAGTRDGLLFMDGGKGEHSCLFATGGSIHLEKHEVAESSAKRMGVGVGRFRRKRPTVTRLMAGRAKGTPIGPGRQTRIQQPTRPGRVHLGVAPIGST